MRPIHRWSLVALAVALVVLVPITVRALPVPDESISARDLLARVQAGDGAGYSGTVEVHGRLGLPVSDHFTDIADLLGSDTRMRVWWRSPDQWRVDKLLPDGRGRPLPPRPRDDPVGLRARRGAERHRPSDPASPRRRPAAAGAGPPGADRCRPGRRHPPSGTPHRRARRARPAAAAERPADEHRPRRPVGRRRHRAGARARRLRRRVAAGAQHGVHERRPQPAAGSRDVRSMPRTGCARPSTTCSTSPTPRTSTPPSSRPTPSRG